jgi:hypothetical protein
LEDAALELGRSRGKAYRGHKYSGVEESRKTFIASSFYLRCVLVTVQGYY